MLFTEKTKNGSFAKDPAVVKFNDKYLMYFSSIYTDEGADRLGIGIAESDDLDNWTVKGHIPFEEDCEQKGIGAPAAIVLDGVLHLFYQSYGWWENDAICHAVSKDGFHFKKDDSNPIFRPTKDWCAGRAIDADVVVFQEKLFLYFATRDGEMKIQKLGVAYADIKSDFSRECWTQGVAQSVLYPEFSWEGQCIEAPATIVHEGKIYLFYGGGYNCAPQQIGVAVSEDGMSFRKIFNQPFIPVGKDGSWNSCESGHPYVFEDDGNIWLFYQGTADMGKSWYLSKCRIQFRDGKPYVCE